jgi:hypothetical protein
VQKKQHAFLEAEQRASMVQVVPGWPRWPFKIGTGTCRKGWLAGNTAAACLAAVKRHDKSIVNAYHTAAGRKLQ